MTGATEPISPADQIQAPQVAQAVSAARGSLVDDAAQPPPPLSSSQVARISLNREIARARLLSRGPRCCKCGPSGTCSRCSCARADPPRPCSDCRAGSCQNIARPPSLSAISAVPCDLSVSSGPVNGNLPTLSTVLSTDSRRVPTVRHVPKNARNAWASILTSTLNNILSDPDSIACWTKLFMLPRCTLSAPSPSRSRNNISKTHDTTIKQRLNRWSNDDIITLWSEASSSPLQPDCALNPEAAKLGRVKQAMEDGQYSKAAKMLASDGLVAVSEQSHQEMQSKHPDPDTDSLSPDLSSTPPASDYVVPPSLVSECIKSFPNGTSPGPSGLRASHLKEGITCPSPTIRSNLLNSLCDFVNLLSQGKVPAEIVPHLCGALLLGTRKKSGGLRPIAVGEVLRRLVSKCLVQSFHQLAANHLSPHQLGVGIPNGAEAIVHAVRSVLQCDSLPDSNKYVLQLDFSNAFNTISRNHMFTSVRSHLPSISSWLELCYRSSPFLHFGDHIILSKCGVQQGDPLGPLGFAMALHPLIEQVKDEVPELVLNAWYLDDGTLCGTLDDLTHALDIIESVGPSYGLSLNRSKCLLYCPTESSITLRPDIPITHNGFSLLGAPIGPPEFCNQYIIDKGEQALALVPLLSSLQDSQMAITLLRSCWSFGKMSYLLRSTPSLYISEALSTFDRKVQEAFVALLGTPVSPWCWLKATLPVSMGGLNLRCTSLHSPAAYISSVTSCAGMVSDIVNSPSAISLLPSLAPYTQLVALHAEKDHWLSIADIDVPVTQRALSTAINQASLRRLIDSAPDSRSRALALSSSIQHAGDWLSVIPSRALGLHMLDQEFRACLHYWLGIRLFSEGPCAQCSRHIDPFGDHHLSCLGHGEKITRHNTLRDVIFSAARLAALSPRLEAPYLLSNSSARPADVFLPSWKDGSPAALDVTVISPMQQLTLAESAVTQGHALKVAADRKIAVHGPRCQQAGIQFFPLPVETLGGWSTGAASVLKDIGHRQAARLDNLPSATIHHLFQRLSICLWRGNASMWINNSSAPLPYLDGIE